MTRTKTTVSEPLTIDATTLKAIPTPPINLHDLEAVRREMARVYRDMRGKRIDSQEGTRLVYVLSQIAKVHEIAVLEKRLTDLEKLNYEPR